MDFGWDTDQEVLRALAKKVLAVGGDPWSELPRAGLTSVMVPVEHGGAGLGVVEQCLVCVELGRAAAPVELVPSMIAAAALARFGTTAQIEAWLSRGVTLATHELGTPTAIARASEPRDGWRLDGVKLAVPALERAGLILVPARLASGARLLALVPADARGLRRDPGTSTDDARVHQLVLDGVAVGDEALLARDRADEALQWIERHLTVALAAYELGIAARQLEMTAEYVVRRQQFGKPIGLFQAVGQRCADMHIDIESLRLATWEAAYLVDGADAQTTESAETAATLDAAVATAAFWAAEAGARVAAAAQHLHGGIGFDRAYPLYRYFLAAKRVELELGGATQQLARLGRILATAPQEGAS
jgi:alkylation response protein AidB-like acyl-CoA dehydrogenase